MSVHSISRQRPQARGAVRPSSTAGRRKGNDLRPDRRAGYDSISRVCAPDLLMHVGVEPERVCAGAFTATPIAVVDLSHAFVQAPVQVQTSKAAKKPIADNMTPTSRSTSQASAPKPHCLGTKRHHRAYNAVVKALIPKPARTGRSIVGTPITIPRRYPLIIKKLSPSLSNSQSRRRAHHLIAAGLNRALAAAPQDRRQVNGCDAPLASPTASRTHPARCHTCSRRRCSRVEFRKASPIPARPSSGRNLRCRHSTPLPCGVAVDVSFPGSEPFAHQSCRRAQAPLAGRSDTVSVPLGRVGHFPGKSIPNRRIRCPWISMVSPSITEALPAISATASWAKMTNSTARRKIRRRIVKGPIVSRNGSQPERSPHRHGHDTASLPRTACAHAAEPLGLTSRSGHSRAGGSPGVPERENLAGPVERVTFHTEDSGFSGCGSRLAAIAI